MTVLMEIIIIKQEERDDIVVGKENKIYKSVSIIMTHKTSFL